MSPENGQDMCPLLICDSRIEGGLVCGVCVGVCKGVESVTCSSGVNGKTEGLLEGDWIEGIWPGYM